ncbi:SRPBCC family protein [Nocardioides donggukensis]|uniref:SRPBCC domain-containing protein n=1 Tax=Nocardioides donggukensis TaxID=2774019 RepID=A0A927PYM2_9ACTN|nr:SRPBCC domain-containing protein [Nocardioides donggukensis]MBD8868453.1 SRPBCC domain-containing protein [Nocardioides donggukensis]
MTSTADQWVLELSRMLDGTRERTFRALTDPVELAQWWGPAGFTTPEVRIDLYVGGGYRFGMQPPEGSLFHLVGEFLEVEPPSRLAYSFRWEDPDPDDRETVVSIHLEDMGSRTQLSVRQGPFATEARLALHTSGWTESLQRLSAHIRSTP